MCLIWKDQYYRKFNFSGIKCSNKIWSDEKFMMSNNLPGLHCCQWSCHVCLRSIKTYFLLQVIMAMLKWKFYLFKGNKFVQCFLNEFKSPLIMKANTQNGNWNKYFLGRRHASLNVTCFSVTCLCLLALSIWNVSCPGIRMHSKNYEDNENWFSGKGIHNSCLWLFRCLIEFLNYYLNKGLNWFVSA